MLPTTAFGKNDIRGIYGDDITEELYYYTGRAFVKYLEKKSGKQTSDIWVTICFDARTHSPSLCDALTKGVLSTSANVIDLGLAPTPIGYFSETVGVDSTITDGQTVLGALIITASHNPSQYNGLKMTHEKQTLNEAQIAELKEITIDEYNTKYPTRLNGKIKKYDIFPDYTQEIIADFSNLRRIINNNLKIVVDSGNATGGIIAPQLYRSLGCKVVELYSTPDGRFPNHHPNPSDPKNLEDLKRTVIAEKADFGIAFDGDSDRIGVVDNEGNHLTGDKLLYIYALDVVQQYKMKQITPVVVSEVKCSQVLFDMVNKIGGQAVMCKTGHGYVKGKMKETGAVLAGEMSGHTFFKDRHYGYDDAIYAGCRIIEIFAKQKAKNANFILKDLLSPFDKVYSSPEVRFNCPNELKKPVLQEFETLVRNNNKLFTDEIKEIITLDGMRIVFNNGFALIRQSNTEPVFTLRFEAETEQKSNQYKEAMTSNLDKLINKHQSISV